MSDKIYFANMGIAEIGPDLMRKVDEYYDHLQSSGYYKRIEKSFRAYYGMPLTGRENTLEITSGGAQDELSYIRVNHYRNLAQHLLNLTTSQRPSPQPIAANSDHKSLSQATLASGLLDYYSREKRVERNLKLAAEQAIVMSEGYIKIEWDTSLGEEVMPEERDEADPQSLEKMVREGDIRFSNLSPLDVVKDPSKENSQDMDWCITRQFVNRYEMASRYPELTDKILDVDTKEPSELLKLNFGSKTTTDDIPVYEFFHRKSDAVPDGKYVAFISGDVVLYYGDLPYRQIPLRRIAPAELIGSPFGYSPMFDLLAIQEAIDALYSVVVTNQTTFGVQNIMAPKGHDIQATALSGALNLIEYDDKLGKPEALNLTHTPAEIFNFIEQLEAVMETLSGINSTVRGNPETSLKSGSALALVQSQAIQFSSGLQASYSQLVEDVYTDALNLLRDYAKSKRVVAIVGKNNRYMLREFNGDDFSEINRVVVNSGSAMSQTLSGRMQIAQDLIQNGMIKRPEEYLNVVITGNLQPLMEGDHAELMLVRDENEEMQQGKMVEALAIDAHSLHIREHRCVLASPEMRNNPDIVNIVTAHIMQHIELLRGTDPMLLAMLGEQSLSVPPPPPETQAGGTPAKNPKGQQPNPEAPEEPAYPENPQTGNEWDPNTGGGVIPPQ